MQWFKSNTTLKLISLLLAIIVWFFVKALITETPAPKDEPSGLLRMLGLVGGSRPSTNAVPRNTP
jgi:hypothetical protein